MTNRKKRLEKGINSLQEQIDIHQEKKKTAEELGNTELADYYTKEIKAKEETKRRKEEILDKQ
jgi:phage shock protein A